MAVQKVNFCALRLRACPQRRVGNFGHSELTLDSLSVLLGRTGPESEKKAVTTGETACPGVLGQRMLPRFSITVSSIP
jgi:hypothetical protein